jgi:hypothetical protein
MDACTVIVAATGPSLTSDVVAACIGRHVIAVNDAWRLFPDAIALYAADASWWKVHDGVSAFTGRKVVPRADLYGQRDLEQLAGWGIEAVQLDHGQSSLYGAISLARLLGYSRVGMVGADMRKTDPRHFFGDHPSGLRNDHDFTEHRQELDALATRLPPGFVVLNCTPNSALTAFKFVRPEDL